LEARSIPERLPDGTILWDGFFLDITERKKFEKERETLLVKADVSKEVLLHVIEIQELTEQALRESEERAKILFAESPDAYLIVEEGIVVDCNRAAENFLQVNWEQIIGKPLDDFAPELQSDGQSSGDVLKGLWGNSVSSRYQIYEITLQRINGTLLQVEVSVTKMTLGGKVVLFASLRDISVRKQMEESLRNSELKFSTLFASMNEVVVLHKLVFDDHGNPVNYVLTDCNSRFINTFGISKDDTVGKLITEVFNLDTPPFLEVFSRVAITGEPHQFEYYADNICRHLSISVVSPMKNNFATVVSDVTEKVESQKLIAAKNLELQQIVYVASHDLRSPLLNIDGYGRKLEDFLNKLSVMLVLEKLTDNNIIEELSEGIPDGIKSLKYIRKSTGQMDALIKGLLKLSRSGGAALSLGPLNMNELVAEVVAGMGFQINEKGAELILSDLPPCLGDKVQVSQVFNNLIDNALKYSDPSRKLVIKIGGTVEKGRCIYCVEDNGIGIATEHQKKIFELFHRLDKLKTTGEGLGLTLVSQILGRLNGVIHVDSKPGVGSLFYVTLPKFKA
jgi:PAS domain S-box-containing protein